MKSMLILLSLSIFMGQANAEVQKNACFKTALKAYKAVSSGVAFEIKKPFEIQQGKDLLDFYGHVIMTVDEDVIVYPVHSSFHSGYQIDSIVLTKNNCDLVAIKTNYSE